MLQWYRVTVASFPGPCPVSIACSTFLSLAPYCKWQKLGEEDLGMILCYSSLIPRPLPSFLSFAVCLTMHTASNRSWVRAWEWDYNVTDPMILCCRSDDIVLHVQVKWLSVHCCKICCQQGRKKRSHLQKNRLISNVFTHCTHNQMIS